MEDRGKKKKKKAVATVATMSLEQTKVALQQLFKTWGGGGEMAHYTKRGTVKTLPLFI